MTHGLAISTRGCLRAKFLNLFLSIVASLASRARGLRSARFFPDGAVAATPRTHDLVFLRVCDERLRHVLNAEKTTLGHTAL